MQKNDGRQENVEDISACASGTSQMPIILQRNDANNH